MDIMNHCLTIALSCLLRGFSCLELVLQGRTLVLEAADRLAASQKTDLFCWDHWALCPHSDLNGFFLLCFLASSVGLRNLKVCHHWNIFVSGVAFCFPCYQGSAFLPTAAAFFWSSLTLEDASSILSLVIQAFSLALQLWESVPSYSLEYTWNGVFGSWVLLDVRTAWF